MASPSDDDLVSIGTALHEGEEDDETILISRKHQHVSQQTVHDEKGRQRFHGAFTGGFSAGYYNTVGSKEGFEPKTFKSTASQRAEKQAARPEDFMDDEDFKSHGIAPKMINVSENFNDQKSSGLKRPVGLLGRNTSLGILIVPTRNSVGVRLLMKMGVKEGQGIGARLSKKEKLARKKKKAARQEEVPSSSSTEAGIRTFGCTRPPPEYVIDHDSDDDPYSTGHLFAPDDAAAFQFSAKDNVHGIGYSGLRTGSILGSNRVEEISEIKTDKGFLKMKGHAFGVGALEEDDDDIYAQDSMSNYDFTLESKPPSEITRFTSEGAAKKPAAPSVYKGVIPGFLKTSAALVVKKRYPAPILPKGFNPDRTTPQEEVVEEATKTTWRSLNADNRWGMTADSSLSVFDYLKEEDRLKLKALQKTPGTLTTPATHTTPVTPATGANMTPCGTSRTPGSLMTPGWARMTPGAPSVTPVAPSMTPGAPSVTPVAPSVMPSANHFNMNWAAGGLSSKLKPFADKPEKQARFENFLTTRSVSVSEGRGLTEWERRHEGEEFVRAAMMYSRAPSHMITSRFVSAGMSTGLEDAAIGDKIGLPPEEMEEAAAAEKKLYGKMTRQRHEWHPEKLLTKRFNVPDPYPGSITVGIPGTKKGGYSVSDLLEASRNSWQRVETEVDPAADKNETEKTQTLSPDAAQTAETKRRTTEKVAELLSSVRKKVALKSNPSAENMTKRDSSDSVGNGSDRPSSSMLLSHLNDIPVPTESTQNSKNDPPEKTPVAETDSGASKDAGTNQVLVADETPPVSAAATSTRPPMDLFKAIFANSDSEESSEDEPEEQLETKPTEISSTAKPQIETETTAKTFPPRNESATLTWQRGGPDNSSSADKNRTSVAPGTFLTFGPALPPPRTIPLPKQTSPDKTTPPPASRRTADKNSSHKQKKAKKRKHKSKEEHRHRGKAKKSKKSLKSKKAKKKHSKNDKYSSDSDSDSSTTTSSE